MTGRYSGQQGSHYPFASNRYAKSGANKTATPTPVAYKSVSNCIQGKITSYKTLYSQTHGPARCPRPSPTVLNTFSNWIDKGAIIQTCTTAQVARWARTTNKNFNTHKCTPVTCKNVLTAKFGKSTIKAVARTKSGSFMVATTPTVKGHNFSFPK